MKFRRWVFSAARGRLLLRLGAIAAAIVVCLPARGQSRLVLPDFSDLFLPEFVFQDSAALRRGLMVRDDQAVIIETLLSDYVTGFARGVVDVRRRITEHYPMPDDLQAQADRINNAVIAELQRTIEEFRQAEERGDADATTALRAKLAALQSAVRQEREEARPAPLPPEKVRSVGDEIINELLTWREQRNELRRSFVDGIAVVLDDAQRALWPAVEMRLRRQRERDDGRLSGESVDLEALASETLSVGDREGLEDALASHAAALDGLLREKREYLEVSKFELYRAAMAGDSSRALAVVQREIELRTRIRDLNLGGAKELARRLPADVAATLHTAVRQDGFPRVFRPTSNHLRVITAADRSGLTGAGKAAVQIIVDEYLAAYDEVTQAIYQATIEHEPDLEQQRMLHRFGLRTDTAAGAAEPIQEAYQRRTDLDRETEARLRALEAAPADRGGPAGLARQPIVGRESKSVNGLAALAWLDQLAAPCRLAAQISPRSGVEARARP